MSRKYTTRREFKKIIKELEEKDLKLVCMERDLGHKTVYTIQLGFDEDDYCTVLQNVETEKYAKEMMVKYQKMYEQMLSHGLVKNQWCRDFLEKQKLDEQS